VQPEVQSIAPVDIQQAKAQALANRAQKIQTRGAGIVTTLAAYRALSDAFHGNFGAIPTVFGEGLAGYGVAYGLSRLLENPAVVEKLTKPTPRDVAAIPPELARDMEPIIEQAKAKGIKVNPALLTAVSAASSSKWYSPDNQ
jgi:L-rhamnose isomerase